MKASDLKPAKTFAQSFGVKIVIYGKAGTGKTPLIDTLPSPVLLATEPGIKSLKHSNVPTWIGDTWAKIEEFHKWFTESAEAKKFDSLAVDSISQMAELKLAEEKPKHRDPRKAYGKMAEEVYTILDDWYWQRDKHIYMIAKEMMYEQQGGIVKYPYFPGKDLTTKAPHLYDEIFHIGEYQIPQVGMKLALRTKQAPDVLARDRSGNLAELEYPDIGEIIKKCMG